MSLTADVFEYYAGLALDIKGQVVSNYVSDAIGMILKDFKQEAIRTGDEVATRLKA